MDGADTRQLRALVERLAAVGKNGAEEVRRATIDIARRAGPFAVKAVRENLNLNAKRVKKGLTVTMQAGVSVTLTGSKKPISLVSYGARQLGNAQARGYGSGVSVRVTRGGSLTRLVNAFIARGGRSGDSEDDSSDVPRLVFQRSGKPRLPIEAKFGPSIADAMNRPKFKTATNKFVSDKAQEIVRQRLIRIRKRSLTSG